MSVCSRIPKDDINNLILTNFYSTIVDPKSGCVQEPDTNYTPYLIFCLKTKLFPYIIDILGHDIIFSFDTVRIDKRLVVSINFYKDGNLFILSPEQKKLIRHHVDFLVYNEPKVCLLFWSRTTVYLDNGFQIPIYWISKILPYIIVPKNINSYTNDIGIYCTLEPDQTIYNTSLKIVDNNHVGTYLNYYNIIVKGIIKQLKSYYSLGYVFGAKNIKIDWQLEPIDKDELLYRPLWNDTRFAPDLVQFLKNKINGDKSVEIVIDNNLVVRHFIAKSLHNLYPNLSYFFSNYSIIFESTNLNDSRFISSLILNNIYISNGSVVTIYISKSDTNSLSTYLSKIKSLGFNDIITYHLDNIESPNIISILLPIGINILGIKKYIYNNIK